MHRVPRRAVAVAALAVLCACGVVSSAATCSSASEKNVPEYFLLATCHRSRSRVIAHRNYDSLERCKQLALGRRGMGFNYSPPERRAATATDGHLESCQVTACPEIENSTSLQLDARYDYYSMFADPVPPINSSCIPGLGVFVIHLTRTNYTAAKESCEEFGATIADVATESRTNDLAYLVKTSLPGGGPKQVYVGLDDVDVEGDYRRSTGYPLTCTTFRAWAPGHPRSRRSQQDCGTLDADRMWHIVDCRKRLPFVCEIYPGGSHEYYDYYDRPNCIATYY